MLNTPTTLHPSTRTWLAYLDGELPAEQAHSLRSHRDACAACRHEIDTIEADLDWFLVLDAASHPAQAPFADGLERVLAATRDWRTAHPQAAVAAAAAGLDEHFTAELKLFFGPESATVIEASARQAGATGAAAAAESLLAAFLGRRAAASFVADVRRRVELDRFLAPDVTG